MNARHDKYLIGIVSLSRTHQNSITLLIDLDLESEFKKKQLSPSLDVSYTDT